MFGGYKANRVRSADKRIASKDTRQISANLGRIDKQLEQLERLRGAVGANHDQHAKISAEKAHLKEQGRALKLAKKAERLGASPKDVAKSGGILSLLARRKR